MYLLPSVSTRPKHMKAQSVIHLIELLRITHTTRKHVYVASSCSVLRAPLRPAQFNKKSNLVFVLASCRRVQRRNRVGFCFDTDTCFPRLRADPRHVRQVLRMSQYVNLDLNGQTGSTERTYTQVRHKLSNKHLRSGIMFHTTL